MHKSISILFLCFGLVNSFIVSAKTPVATEHFFAEPDMVVAKLSPDGNSIATIRFTNDKPQIWLIDSATKQATLWFDVAEFSKRQASIKQLAWIDNQYIAAQFVEIKKGVEGLLDTKAVQRLILLNKPVNNTAQVEVLSVTTKGSMVHPLPEQKHQFLYAKSGLVSKIYRLNVNKLSVFGKKLNKLHKIDGGQFKKSNEVASIKGWVTRWFLDSNGQSIAAFHLNHQGEWNLSKLVDKAEPQVLHTWDFANITKNKSSDITSPELVPIAYTGEEDSFYCLDLNEDEQRTIYKVNFTTYSEAIVYQSDAYKVIDIDLSEDNKLSAIKVINNGRIETVYIDNNRLKQHVDLPNNPSLVAQVDATKDNSVRVYYSENHDQPGEFYVQRQAEVGFLGAMYPNIKDQLGSELVEQTVTVEGLEIPFLLNLPLSQKSPVPLIIMPHGGPIGVFDNRYYNPITQLLVSNGYAVLQVNFRGSSGYSTELKDAGKKQFGDLMLKDIYQASEQVLAMKRIDKNRVCTFGMSYGGYAALMLAIQHPKRYKCAASFAGVSDINLLLDNTNVSDKQRLWLKEYIGDSVTEYDRLKAISPLYLADKIPVPVFIGHGSKDEVVDVEHAFRMKLMLEKHQKPFTWYINPEGEHSFADSKQASQYFERLLEFLHTNI